MFDGSVFPNHEIQSLASHTEDCYKRWCFHYFKQTGKTTSPAVVNHRKNKKGCATIAVGFIGAGLFSGWLYF